VEHYLAKFATNLDSLITASSVNEFQSLICHFAALFWSYSRLVVVM
jgi:hypothetical protein